MKYIIIADDGERRDNGDDDTEANMEEIYEALRGVYVDAELIRPVG